MAITNADYIGGGRIAAVLSRALHENLYDPVSLRAAMTLQPYMGGGSATQNITTVTRGYPMAAASSETTGGFSATDPTTSQYQLTIARYGLVFNATDLFHITGQGAALDLDYLLGMLSEALDLTLTDLLVALFANISTSVGTSGVNASVDDVYDAIFALALANNLAGPYMAVLHGQQCNDVMNSIRGENGPIQYRDETQRAVTMGGIRRGDGYRFTHAGVDFHQCGSVGTTNGGADRDGCIFTPGAFAYTLGNTGEMEPQIPSEHLLVQTPELFIERDRDSANGDTLYYAISYPGVAEAEDARAVRFVTDA